MPAIRRLWREFAWVVAGEIVGAAGALVAVRWLTSSMSPREYGQLALGLTLATLLSQTLLGPLANAGERFFALATEQRLVPELMWSMRRLTATASVVSLGVGVLAMGIFVLLGYPDWAGLSAAGCGFALTSGWERILDGMQNAVRARQVVAWHQALRQWLRPAFAVVALVAVSRSGSVALASFAVASAVVLVSQVAFARRRNSTTIRQPFALQRARATQHRLVRYAAPFTLWGVFTWLQLSADRWALQLMGPPEAVGLYAVLLQLGVYPLTVAGSLLSQLAVPIIFASVGDGTDRDRLRRGFQIAAAIVCVFAIGSLLAIAVGVLLHGPVFELLSGSGYREASAMLPLALAVGGAFNIGQLLCLFPMAAGDSRALIAPKIGTALLSVPAYLVGAAQAGIIGVLMANLIVAIIFALWTSAIAVMTLRRVTS